MTIFFSVLHLVYVTFDAENLYWRMFYTCFFSLMNHRPRYVDIRRDTELVTVDRGRDYTRHLNGVIRA